MSIILLYYKLDKSTLLKICHKLTAHCLREILSSPFKEKNDSPNINILAITLFNNQHLSLLSLAKSELNRNSVISYTLHLETSTHLTATQK